MGIRSGGIRSPESRAHKVWGLGFPGSGVWLTRIPESRSRTVGGGGSPGLTFGSEDARDLGMQEGSVWVHVFEVTVFGCHQQLTVLRDVNQTAGSI